MAQPVYIATPLSDEEFLGIVFAVPFLGGLFWLAYQASEVWTFHPVLRILIWGAAAATGILGGLRPVRIVYALVVAAIGTGFILAKAPDALWIAFLEAVLLLVWGAISIGFEKQMAHKSLT